LVLFGFAWRSETEESFDTDVEQRDLAAATGFESFDDTACADFSPGRRAGSDPLALVNKTADNQLDPGWAPGDLRPVPAAYMMPERRGRMRWEALLALTEMLDAADREEIVMVVRSAFRSYHDQCVTFRVKRRVHGIEHARRFSALPGRSEHQLGTTVDL